MSTPLRLASLLALALALIASVITAGTARADPKPASIRGVILTLVDGKPQPVVGAHVIIKRDGKVTQHVQTNDKGQFAFPKVGPGIVVVHADAKGFNPAAERVALTPGEDEILKLHLRQHK